MNPNDLARNVVDAAIKVHSALGPGLLESVYEACLAHEIAGRGLRVERQVVLPVRYGDVTVEAALRLDLLVGEGLVVEIKAVESLQPIHAAQLLTYLRLGCYPLGLLLNFNVVHMKSGIKRLANGVSD